MERFPQLTDPCVMYILWFVLLAVAIKAIAGEHRAKRRLRTDGVTGGWSWPYFVERVRWILDKPQNRRRAFAIVVLQLERYTNYCACHGMKEGEALLTGIDGFLRMRTERDEVSVRYESAKFCLLMRCAGDTEEEQRGDCQRRACSLLAELAALQPERKVHFHAGICMLPAKGERNRQDIDILQCCHYADIAGTGPCDCGETGGEHKISFFDGAMFKDQVWKQYVEEHMEEGLRDGEFEVYLQPKYNPVTRRMTGAEALVRWNRPGAGIIEPPRFVPILEENGFITKLDDYMVTQVAKLLARWMIRDKKMVPVSVNISRAHFAQEGLAEHICRLVDAYGAKRGMVELEVAEDVFLEDREVLIGTIRQLKAYGFCISMDDFGTGYSSLNSLKDMPFDGLKLDTDFFRGEGDMERGEIIVRETIRLAKRLGMSVVAEGIEEKEQVEFLAGLGCDMIQGYYFAGPLPVGVFEKKMEREA